MSKPRFDDPDLHTPEHDAIMCWLDENAHEALVAAFGDLAGLGVRSTTWEEPFKFSGGTRFIDMVIRGRWVFGFVGMEGYVELACEVKPSIRSVGELVRQLRQYGGQGEKYGGQQRRRVAVVCPDDRAREIIESQGFLFIKAPQPDCRSKGGLF
jgi:hypothetical protein